MTRFTFAAIAAFGLLASACATQQPEPDRESETGAGAGTEMGTGNGTGTGNGNGSTAPVVDRTPDPEPEPQGPTPGSMEDFEVTAGDRVFYGFDQHNLTSQARSTLRRQAAWLSSYPDTRILIAGNCDERGTREYNLALGARRANAARDYLVSQGVDPSRIETVSYGKERPVCNESTEECWARNRNATTIIQSGASS